MSLVGGQSTRHVHWKIQYDRQVDKNPMARVIDDPSLERPRYVEGVGGFRSLRFSTFDRVGSSSLEEKLPRVSLSDIYIQHVSSFHAFPFIHYRLEIFQVRDNFFSTELNSPSIF